MTSIENFPHISKFFTRFISSTSPAIRMPKGVDVWLQLDNEVST